MVGVARSNAHEKSALGVEGESWVLKSDQIKCSDGDVIGCAYDQVSCPGANDSISNDAHFHGIWNLGFVIFMYRNCTSQFAFYIRFSSSPHDEVSTRINKQIMVLSRKTLLSAGRHAHSPSLLSQRCDFSGVCAFLRSVHMRALTVRAFLLRVHMRALTLIPSIHTRSCVCWGGWLCVCVRARAGAYVCVCAHAHSRGQPGGQNRQRRAGHRVPRRQRLRRRRSAIPCFDV